MIIPDNPIYDPIKDKSLEKNRCFLCGVKLNKSNRTEEHIFPKWLLNKFNLWDEKLTLLNKESISYRKIMIPCCNECNNIHLGKLEKVIERTSKDEYKEFKKVPKGKIWLWLQKIFYQILYMELRLLFNPAKKLEGKIIDKETIEQYRMCHLFLQSLRIRVKFHKPSPWSVFVVKVQEHDERKLNFDFKDNPVMLTVAIRMGDIGIIACLQDNNALEAVFGNIFRKIKGATLHPIQFDELIARMFYQASLLNRVPKYITHLGKDRLDIFPMPLAGMSSKPIYDAWIPKDYAKWLSFHCGLDYNKVYQPPDKVWSILYDEKGQVRELDIETCGF